MLKNFIYFLLRTVELACYSQLYSLSNLSNESIPFLLRLDGLELAKKNVSNHNNQKSGNKVCDEIHQIVTTNCWQENPPGTLRWIRWIRKPKQGINKSGDESRG